MLPGYWGDHAECKRYDGDMWYPTKRRDACLTARKICVDECPVRPQCAQDGYDRGEVHAVIGGFCTHTAKGRRDLAEYLELPPRRSDVERICAACGARFCQKQGHNLCMACKLELVPTDRAHAHIVALADQGWTHRDIAAAASLPKGTISSIATPNADTRRRHVTRLTEQHVLSVPLTRRVAS